MDYSPLSARPLGGICAGDATQGE